MKTILTSLFGLFVACVACGGSDGDIGVEEATASECPSGGTVLVDNGERFPVCDGDGQGPKGERGATGAVGATGAQGPAGVAGVRGAAGAPGPSDVIESTILCSTLVTLNGVEAAGRLSAFIWVMSDGDAVGMCTFSANLDYSETSPIIGDRCVLNGGFDTIELITVNFSVNPPAITGGLIGTLGCQ